MNDALYPGSSPRPVCGEHRGRHHSRLLVSERGVRSAADGQAHGHVRGGGHVRAAGRHRAQEVQDTGGAQQRDQSRLWGRAVCF